MAVTLQCRKHPKYKAMRKPTADCEACRRLFNLKQFLERELPPGKKIKEAKPKIA